MSTVGESAALGASGVVMWGGTKDYNNKVNTLVQRVYLFIFTCQYVCLKTGGIHSSSDVIHTSYMTTLSEIVHRLSGFFSSSGVVFTDNVSVSVAEPHAFCV